MTPLAPFPGPSDHSRIRVNNVGRDQYNQTNIVTGDQHNVTYESRGSEYMTLEMTILFFLIILSSEKRYPPRDTEACGNGLHNAHGVPWRYQG